MQYKIIRFFLYLLLFTTILFAIEMTGAWLLFWMTGNSILHYIHTSAASLTDSMLGQMVLMICFAGGMGLGIALASFFARWWSRYLWLQIGMSIGIVFGCLVLGCFTLGAISAWQIYTFWNSQADGSAQLGTMLEGGFYFVDRGLLAFAKAIPLNFFIFALATGLAWLALHFVERSERRFYPKTTDTLNDTDHFIS